MPVKFQPIEYILIGSLIVTIVIAGYLTFMRVVYGIDHITYDAWIFAMNLALLLTIYENHCGTIDHKKN